MTPRSRGVRHALDVLSKSTSSTGHVCRSCRHALFQRTYASAAAAQVTVELSSESDASNPTHAASPRSPIDIKAGILLSRAPLLTADPHPFETSFHLYQRRLNERLVLPFTQYFYFRRGTPAFNDWRTRRKDRGGAATRDVGKYNAYDKEAWNDEVLLGDESGEPRKIVEQLIDEEGRAEEFSGEKGDVKVGGLRRRTEADEKNDERSLERSLSRTLYLLVKSKAQAKDVQENTLWKFPSGPVESREGLKEAAQRILGSSCGPNMNTWFVGNHPVGHYSRDLTQENTTTTPKSKSKSKSKKTSTAAAEEPAASEEKTFFMKARIFAGQADVKSTPDNSVEDFKWLAKDEIEKVVTPAYYSRVKNMLVEQ